jgi:acyl-CoA synthetase (AMP-forming)/AMP-acid ligase II
MYLIPIRASENTRSASAKTTSSFSPPKIFFAYGFGNSVTYPFSVGASTVLHPGRPDAEAVFAAIERHRPTILFGLPTLYNALLAHPAQRSEIFRACDCASLRLKYSPASCSANGSDAMACRSWKAVVVDRDCCIMYLSESNRSAGNLGG